MEPDVGAIACKLGGKSLTRSPIAPRDHDPGRTVSPAAWAIPAPSLELLR